MLAETMPPIIPAVVVIFHPAHAGVSCRVKYKLYDTDGVLKSNLNNSSLSLGIFTAKKPVNCYAHRLDGCCWVCYLSGSFRRFLSRRF